MSKEIDIIIKEAREELDELFGLPFKLGSIRRPKGIKRLSTPDDKEVYKKTVEDDFFSDDSAGDATYEGAVDIEHIAKLLTSNERIMRKMLTNHTIKNILKKDGGPQKFAKVIQAVLNVIKHDLDIKRLKENSLKETIRAIRERSGSRH